MKQIGCVACWLGGYWAKAARFQTEIHHLLSGGRRRGHQYTIALCVWHHRSDPDYGMTKTQMAAKYGPSLAGGSKPFHETFGSDAEMLEAQNAMLDAPIR